MQARGCSLLRRVAGRRAGVYALALLVGETISFTTGSASFTIPPGLYVYVGSAGNGLVQRLCRHLEPKPGRKVRWHIDRLTESSAAKPLCTVYALDVYGKAYESCIASKLATTHPYVPGFGSTDDPHTPSHLIGPLDPGNPSKPLRDVLEAVRSCTRAKTYGILCLSLGQEE